MKIVLSVSYFGETAMPSNPPSPDGLASAIFWTSVTVRPSGPASGPTLRILVVSRSVTNADRSGRKAIPQGTARCLAMTVVTTPTSPASALGETDGVGNFGGEPAWSGGGGPK